MGFYCGELPGHNGDRSTLGKLVKQATQAPGDFVMIDRETLTASGIDPNTIEYCDWLDEFELRQYRKRLGVYSIGRRPLCAA